MDKFGEPSCVCLNEISKVLHLICAINGQTYGNRREMDFDACKHKVPLHVLFEGECFKKKPSTGVLWGVSLIQWITVSGGASVVSSLIRIRGRVSAGNVF